MNKSDNAHNSAATRYKVKAISACVSACRKKDLLKGQSGSPTGLIFLVCLCNDQLWTRYPLQAVVKQET